MGTCMRWSGVTVSLLCLAATGCRLAGSTVWVQSVEEISLADQITIDGAEKRSLESVDLSVLEVRTHNGRISFTGQDVGKPGAISVTKKARAYDQIEAEAALAAIEVFVERQADGKCKVGWRWSKPKRRSWNAAVDFEITASQALALDLKTHNGRIYVAGAESDVVVVSHNGRLVLDCGGGKLYGETHNGRIEAVYAGGNLQLETHNGRIRADMRQCKVPNGSLKTYNGAVELILDNDASVQVTGRTHNGRVTCQVPLTAGGVSKRKLAGTMADGKGKLDVVTYNGSIRVW